MSNGIQFTPGTQECCVWQITNTAKICIDVASNFIPMTVKHTTQLYTWRPYDRLRQH